jgi:hypothetical protein
VVWCEDTGRQAHNKNTGRQINSSSHLLNSRRGNTVMDD